MNDALNVLGLAFFGSVVALIGGVVFLYSRRLSDKLSCYSIPFAAGVLLTVALIGILPEVSEAIGNRAFVIVLFSFFGSYFFEYFLFEFHHHESKHVKGKKAQISLVVVGDTIHNFVDGLAIAASYLINPGLGFVTTISTFLHEVPHEIGDFGILLNAGWKKKKVLFVNFVSALATILGAVLMMFFDKLNILNVSDYLLAVAAGMFLYLGASDFLPHIHEGKVSPAKSAFALFLGVVIMYLTLSAIPHF